MMWTTLGSLAPIRYTPRRLEALGRYVRDEFGEENVLWYFGEARRAARKRKASASHPATQNGDRALGVLRVDRETG